MSPSDHVRAWMPDGGESTKCAEDPEAEVGEGPMSTGEVTGDAVRRMDEGLEGPPREEEGASIVDDRPIWVLK